jgi:hypothetical protein
MGLHIMNKNVALKFYLCLHLNYALCFALITVETNWRTVIYHTKLQGM